MSTRLFKTYAANAPFGTWPANTTTHQGLYCMTVDGGYLSGKFAGQSGQLARETLSLGLAKWREISAQLNHKPKPVPTDSLELYGGEPLEKGGLKLEVAYRDFPRGEVQRPGDPRMPNPYNLGWFDFTAAEAQAFLAEGDEKRALPDSLFREFASRTLKDSVRGQSRDWKDGELQSGELFAQLAGQNGSVKTFTLTGSANFLAGDLSYAPTLLGSASYDTATGEFTSFRLIAAGQRTGKSGANARETDLGPAPMGVGFKLYRSE